MYVTGNVAYEKAISTNRNWGANGRGVDGNTDPDVDNHHCFQHGHISSGDAWWMVDLGDQHIIYNMTVYSTDHFCKYYEYG